MGGARDACPPGGPNSFDFMQFFGKFGNFVCWRPPGELAPPPRGNPGSATDMECDISRNYHSDVFTSYKHEGSLVSTQGLKHF